MSAQTMLPVSAWVRSEERDTFYTICEPIGTTPSNAIRMFASAFNRKGGFPYDSVEEMFAAMELEDEED